VASTIATFIDHVFVDRPQINVRDGDR